MQAPAEMGSPSPSDKEMASKAFKAVEPMGFPREVTNRVLKRLFKTYQNCWAHIMADNYAVFVEALLEETADAPQPQVDGGLIKKKTGGGGGIVEPEPTKVLQQVKVEEEERPSPPPAWNSDMQTSGSLKRQRMEANAMHELHPGRSEGMLTDSTPFQSSVRPRPPLVVSSQPQIVKKSAEAGSSHPPRVCGRPEYTQAQMNRAGRAATGAAQEKAAPASGSMLRRDKRPVDERAGNTITFKEPKIEPGTEGPSGTTGANCYAMGNKLEEEQCQTDSPLDEMPLASIPPERSLIITAAREELADHVYEAGPSTRTAPILLKNISQSSEVHLTDKNRKEGPPVAMCNKGDGHALQHIHEASSTQIDIASTSSGEVRLSFITCSDLPNFRMPSMEDVLREVEDRCLRSYRIRPSEFSLMNVMREMCRCFLELGSEQTVDKREAMVNVTPTLDALKKSGLKGMHGFSPGSRSQHPWPSSTNGSYPNENRTIGMREESSDHDAANFASNSSVAGPGRLALLGCSRPAYDSSDISKGEEKVRIPVANDTNAVMPSFHYIPQNISYQNAYINISLARIGDEDYCSDCYGNCLAAPIPCACARETGGEFAYTPNGLLKKKFLDECISMNLEPKAEQLFYCKTCPLERSKNEVMPDPCKGHTIRKFIKECWSKCGCNKQCCGNRVVQRGITCNLQVFFTGKGKGWGVRTLDALPRGTFVCEYVGEILTNTELYDRTMETTGKARHTYPVLLDADWGTEGVLKDEEALCLDATFYGNVARFINHRCVDASLVEIPVEVETPDRHYYHLAFFTTRDVEILEELNWDYGIDFDDHTHPIEAFRCHCGSKYCRDLKNQKPRSRKLRLSG